MIFDRYTKGRCKTVFTQKNSAQDLTIAYIGGGSRGWAWGFMMDLAMDPQMGGIVRLYDIDRAAAESNAVIGNKISSHPEASAVWKYEVADTLKAALSGADFVVISILPGTFDEMESDVHAPEKYGIWQSVGDTVGPGGFVRALRTIPMMVSIAEAIREYSPLAWVINYTNPMSLCIRALYETFPAIRAFGCCHEVFSTQTLLANMLEDLHGIKGVTRQEIKVNVTGINHFTWFSSASYNGEDLFPLYREFIDKYYDSGFSKNDKHWRNSSFACSHRVKFDLFRRYGLIAAAGDRHLAEFMPPWYLKDPKSVEDWMFGLTKVSWRRKDLQDRLARSKALVAGIEKTDPKPSGEEGHLLIKALLGLGDIISNVNLPNEGQIKNLPHGAIVETNALFRCGQIQPVQAGPMPENILALTIRHVYNQENTLQTALHYDYSLALSTFMNDPLIGNLSLQDGEKLLREMIENTILYLPEGWTHMFAR